MSDVPEYSKLITDKVQQAHDEIEKHSATAACVVWFSQQIVGSDAATTFAPFAEELRKLGLHFSIFEAMAGEPDDEIPAYLCLASIRPDLTLDDVVEAVARRDWYVTPLREL